MGSTKDSVMSSAMWRMGERIGVSVVTLIVSAVLARILSPDEYGIISVVLVFTTILQVFVDSGLGKALIQRIDAEDIDFSTVFIFNIISSCLLYILLFSCSSYIESFFGFDGLTEYIRICGLILIISGVKNVFQSYVMKKMQFRLFFFSTLSGTILSGVVALIMAYHGMGVWALVAQQIVNPLIDTMVLWFVVDWKPKMQFSKDRLAKLFSFAIKLLAVDLLNEAFNGIRTVFIGKFYTTSDLGCFENGRKIPTSIYSNLDSSIRSVIFPVLSEKQNDKKKIKKYMLEMINVCYYITTPVMFGLAACSDNVVRIMWSDKWIGAVPFMQIVCLVWFLNSIQAINQQVILAQGRSEICLKIEIINKVLIIISLVISVKLGVLAIAMSQLVVSAIGIFLNLYPNRKLIDCTILEQLRSCSVEVLVSFVMAVGVYCIGLLQMNVLVELLIQIIGGIIIYVLASVLFKLKGYYVILGFLKSKLLGRREKNE